MIRLLPEFIIFRILTIPSDVRFGGNKGESSRVKLSNPLIRYRKKEDPPSITRRIVKWPGGGVGGSCYYRKHIPQCGGKGENPRFTLWARKNYRGNGHFRGGGSKRRARRGGREKKKNLERRSGCQSRSKGKVLTGGNGPEGKGKTCARISPNQKKVRLGDRSQGQRKKGRSVKKKAEGLSFSREKLAGESKRRRNKFFITTRKKNFNRERRKKRIK